MRKQVVAYCRWALRLGGTLRSVAAWLGKPVRTLYYWLEAWRRNGLKARRRGRPPVRSSVARRNALLADLREHGADQGVSDLQSRYGDLARREVRDLVQRTRRVWQKRGQVVQRLTWTQPGSVWAMDHTQVRACRVLSCRDLASSYQPLWQRVDAENAARTVERLSVTFDTHGPPLVLKVDNGSGVKNEVVRNLCALHGVLLLPSPPRTPQYNGACEAGIGVLKRRTTAHAECHGRIHACDREDLGRAQQRVNERHQTAWDQRRAITGAERDALWECYRRYFRAIVATSDLQLPRDRDKIDRIVIGHALVERGLLHITRKVIYPPIPTRRRARDS